MGSRHQPSNLPGLFPGQGYPQAEMAFQESKNSRQIDHIMINGTCRRSLQDVRVWRGAVVTITCFLLFWSSSSEGLGGNLTDIKGSIHAERLKRPDVAKAFVLQEKNKFQDRGSKIDFSNPASCLFFYFTPPSRRSEHFYADRTWLN